MMRLFLAVALAAVSLPAYAQDRSSWFKSLRQPGTGISCCDISDCKRTEAKYNGAHWEALVYGRWMEIPDEVVLSKPVSLDGDAYVCAAQSYERIWCFVPPPMGF